MSEITFYQLNEAFNDGYGAAKKGFAPDYCPTSLSAREGKAPPRKVYELRNPVYTTSGGEKFSCLNDNAWREVSPALHRAHQVPKDTAHQFILRG